jgi:CheY-like chemotaxis protein
MPYDVMLMDWKMPVMDGFATAAAAAGADRLVQPNRSSW